jgi:CRISPR-associated protein Cmr4
MVSAMAQTLLYLYTESPLHAGAGGGLGTIDLPIQRERHTDLPIVQGSGIKGALRSRAREQTSPQDPRLLAVFGPEADKASEYAGALTVGDARLLLFPVRSLRGVFAWVTAPLVLRRLRRDLELLAAPVPDWDAPHLPDDAGNVPAQALVTPNNALTLGEGDLAAIVLEEYTFQVRPDEQVGAFVEWLTAQLVDLDPWWAARISTHLTVLPDSAFRDFTLYATEVITRVRIDYATKTVEEGGLWTEESMPTDSLLYCPLLARTPSQPGTTMKDSEALAFVRDTATGIFPIGGDETVGRGLVRTLWSGERRPG